VPGKRFKVRILSPEDAENATVFDGEKIEPASPVEIAARA